MTGESQWRPAAGLAALRARAVLLRSLRDFFAARGVLEVETPLLGAGTGTDPNLEPLALPPGPGLPGPLYLQTSPEFAMKRLLASGSGPIYQICKAFRRGESGGRHNPEFTLLEWYRPGFDEHRLMDEVQELLRQCVGVEGVARRSYAELFEEYVGLDPHAAAPAALAEKARSLLDIRMESDEVDPWLDLLFSLCIEPRLEGAVFIHDYPASQAALARLGHDAKGRVVARRFELVIGGLEIANGYFELTDAAEQRLRFENDRRLRARRDLPDLPADERLLEALAAGLPDCAGVALGLDRLLMAMVGTRSLADILAFPLDRA